MSWSDSHSFRHIRFGRYGTMSGLAESWEVEESDDGDDYVVTYKVAGSTKAIRRLTGKQAVKLHVLLGDASRLTFSPLSSGAPVEDAGWTELELAFESITTKITWNGGTPQNWQAFRQWCERLEQLLREGDA